ncbi:MAG TPA: bifunctional UDP-N-acetylglucosamine diphosphorylase/glucosamine-1-phosphate N-acetyltransferase GlmU [Candidatus Limnocylindrales bacterium]|nr:bifunctional UDP-N-acetylglucosamine diphosphorylase/glucosamine-1-phosphate N-acetyltransferase GlmU [Candidatus Limnocylindrales bacterium]
MVANELTIVILAAGKGTRLKSDLAKVLHRAGGRPLVEHAVRTCQPLAKHILVVVGHQAEDVRNAVAPLGASTVLQRPQSGTGHAMLIARAAIDTSAQLAVVLPGDAPLIRTETLRALVETHRSGRAAATILTAQLADPAGYGRIVRNPDGSVAAIVEDQAASSSEREIREINSGMYCFSLDKLWPCLAALRPENAHRELYLTDTIAMLNQKGERVLAVEATDAKEVFGCNTRVELAEVDRAFRARKATALMDAGVTIYLPETVLIDADVDVAHDTVIEPGVQLLGATRIGSRCTIQTGSVLTNTTLADNVLIRQHCVVTSSILGSGAIIGPFAHLREGSDLRAGARVGNFVEVKKSVLGEGVKAMHLTYLGDATIGRDANIGAGTITCNYDGVKKNPTRIGERVFVGSDSALVAPITVGDGAYIAAGSTVTEDVPANALAIARGRQVNKPGWAAARRAKGPSSKSAAAPAKSVEAHRDAAGKPPGHSRRKSSTRIKTKKNSRR